MYNTGKSVIVDLIIRYYCEIKNFVYEDLSNNGYESMFDMFFELDDNTLITRLGELSVILEK